MESQKSSESTSSSSGEVPERANAKTEKTHQKSRYKRSRNGEYKRQNYGGEGSPSI